MAKELSDFQKAFAAARKAQGAGGEFEYKGTKYSTRRADDKDVTVSASKKFPNKENYKSDAKADADDAATVKRVAAANPQIGGTAPFRRKEIEAETPKPPRFSKREDAGHRGRMEGLGFKWDLGNQDYRRPQPEGMKKGGKVEPKAMMKKEIEFFKKKGAPQSMVKHEEKEAKGYARSGGIESKGKTQGKVVKMARGGGVESRGKTRGRFV